MPQRSVFQLTLGLLAFGLVGECAAEAEYMGSFRWRNDNGMFRGFSALELSEDGRHFLAANDYGFTISGIIRRKDGRIFLVDDDWPWALFSSDGSLNQEERVDTEGLAGSTKGPFFLSFERDHHVSRYAGRTAPEERLPDAPQFASFAFNEGIEALAIDEEGRLYAIPQKPDQNARLNVLRFEAGEWTEISPLEGAKNHEAVGADFGPDGLLYVLERRFNSFGPFRFRIRRFDVDNPGSGETVVESGLVFRNYEGLALWSDADGAVRLTLISDDNSIAFWGTWLREYRLPN